MMSVDTDFNTEIFVALFIENENTKNTILDENTVGNVSDELRKMVPSFGYNARSVNKKEEKFTL